MCLGVFLVVLFVVFSTLQGFDVYCFLCIAPSVRLTLLHYTLPWCLICSLMFCDVYYSGGRIVCWVLVWFDYGFALLCLVFSSIL